MNVRTSCLSPLSSFVDPPCINFLPAAGKTVPATQEPMEPPQVERPLQRKGREELDPRPPQVPQL